MVDEVVVVGGTRRIIEWKEGPVPHRVARRQEELYKYLSSGVTTVASFTAAMTAVARAARVSTGSLAALRRRILEVPWDLEDPVEFAFKPYDLYRTDGWHRLRLEMGR